MIGYFTQWDALVLLGLIIALLLCSLVILLVYHRNAHSQAVRHQNQLRKTMLELRAKEREATEQAKELERTKAALLNMMEDLTDSYEKLKELDELKSDFVTNVSHELRTPLTPISLSLDILDKEKDMKKRREVMEILKRNTKRLHYTIDNILDFSALEAGKIMLESKKFDLRKALRESVQEVKPKADAKGLKLEADVPALSALGDVEWTKRVVLNLLDNAIKFTPKGSVKLIARREKDYIRVSVIDTGRGISKKNLPRLFDKFAKLEKHVPGSGVGLWTCKKMVEEQGGKIEIQTKRGKGTTVSFTLPKGARK